MNTNDVIYVLDSCFGKFIYRLNRFKTIFERKYELLDEDTQFNFIEKFRKYITIRNDLIELIDNIKYNLENDPEKHELLKKCMGIIHTINFYEEDIHNYYLFLLDGVFPTQEKKILH